MLSRLADSCYWMSRYIERAENVARFIGVNSNFMADLPQLGREVWAPMVVTTGDSADFGARYKRPTRENVTQFLVVDEKNPNSIYSCLRNARENARTMRESISSEMWEQVNSFFLSVQSASRRSLDLDAMDSLCQRIRMASHLFVGVADNTMSHGEARHFIRMGRMLERADKTARILDVKYFVVLPKVEDVGTPMDSLLWTALLKAASANQMYRKQYDFLVPENVSEFLLLDREFPRAIRFCLHRAEDSLRAITGSPASTFTLASERQLGSLRNELDYANIHEIIREGLHEYLDRLEVRLNAVGDALHADFFAPQPAPGTPASQGNQQ